MNREKIAARLRALGIEAMNFIPAGEFQSMLDEAEAIVREAVEAATEDACKAVSDNLRSREVADALCNEIRGYIGARGEKTV